MERRERPGESHVCDTGAAQYGDTMTLFYDYSNACQEEPDSGSKAGENGVVNEQIWKIAEVVETASKQDASPEPADGERFTGMRIKGDEWGSDDSGTGA